MNKSFLNVFEHLLIILCFVLASYFFILNFNSFNPLLFVFASILFFILFVVGLYNKMLIDILIYRIILWILFTMGLSIMLLTLFNIVSISNLIFSILISLMVIFTIPAYLAKNEIAGFNEGINLIYNDFNYGEAFDYFDDYVKLEPDNPLAWTGKASALRSLKKYDEALDCSNKALDIKLGLSKFLVKAVIDLNILNTRANVLVSLRRYDEAVEVAERMFKIRYNDPLALNLKGVIYNKLGNYEEALVYYNKAIRRRGKSVYLIPPLSNKGFVLNQLGYSWKAMKFVDKALEINSRFTTSWVVKGKIFISLNKFDDALDCFDECLGLDSTFDEAWSLSAVTLYYLKRHDESLDCFDEGLKFNPQSASIRCFKGVILGKIGKYDEALSYFDESIKLNSNSSSVWYSKGIVLANVGEYDEALKCYNKALELDTDKIVGIWISKGLILDKLGNSLEALECFDKALELYTKVDRSFFILDLVDIDKALIKEPNNVLLYFRKGLILGLLGEAEEALTILNKVLKLNPEFKPAMKAINMIRMDNKTAKI